MTKVYSILFFSNGNTSNRHRTSVSTTETHQTCWNSRPSPSLIRGRPALFFLLPTEVFGSGFITSSGKCSQDNIYPASPLEAECVWTERLHLRDMNSGRVWLSGADVSHWICPVLRHTEENKCFRLPEEQKSLRVISLKTGAAPPLSQNEKLHI